MDSTVAADMRQLIGSSDSAEERLEVLGWFTGNKGGSNEQLVLNKVLASSFIDSAQEHCMLVH